MMSSAVDIDPTFKHALKLLHSSSSDSAEKIRNLLDELIKQRFGGSKTLASTLTKKHLGEESLAPGSNLYVRKQKPAPVVVVPAVVTTLPDSKQASPAKSEPESAVPTPESLTVPPQSGPIILSLSDVEGNDEDDDVVMEEDQLKELEDLMCIVCRRMDVSARNRLVECADCHSLYHQECHKPAISEADANDGTWFCTLCKGKSVGKSSSSTSGSSSRKPETTSSSHSKSSNSKNYESSSSSSSSSKHKSSKSSSSREGSSQRSSERSDRDREKDKEKSSKSSSSGSSAAVGSSSTSSSSSGAPAAGSSSTSGGAGTPNINIISADKRLQMMKKKAAKLHDSKRKHK